MIDFDLGKVDEFLLASLIQNISLIGNLHLPDDVARTALTKDFFATVDEILTYFSV
jgi:hypothetical protein